MVTAPLFALWVGCQKDGNSDNATDSVTDTGTTPSTTPFPLPDDIDTIDFESAFEEAVRRMVTVTTQQPWIGHAATLDRGSPGCPDFWTEPFTSGGVLVSREDGVAWNDDCVNTAGEAIDGWIWWDTNLSADGDPATYEGRTTQGTRTMEGNATIDREDEDGAPLTLFEFDGIASDSLYRVEAYGYERYVYSSQVDATVTGRDVFQGTTTPDGYRTELTMTLTGGDVDNFEARGDVYMFSEVFLDRFDSIGVDFELQGPLGAGPDTCTLEPLGWIGLRDSNAYWYDVVFLPRFEEDIVDIDFPNDPLSVCDGCGKLYIPGVEQEGQTICIDFSFLFERGAVPLPDEEGYVLPWRGLAP
jgi:hypothetical protein